MSRFHANAGPDAPRAICVNSRAALLHLLALLTLAFGLLGGVSQAATFVVTNTTDNNGTCNSGVDCSLREAIKAANDTANADANTPDEITFAIPDAEKVGGVWTIELGSALNSLSEAVTITGPGARLLTVKEDGAGGTFYILTVNNGVSAAFSNLTLSSGLNGIANSGTVSVTNCTLSNNPGNGISNDGMAALTNCTVSGNGDGIYNFGTVNVTNCTLSGNGNGIYSETEVTATNCTLTTNTNTGISNVGGTVMLSNTLCVDNATDTQGNITAGTDSITTGTAADAGLDPNGLQDNGGPTDTVALVDANGDAVDAGDNSLVPGDLITDQRGYGPRINDGTVDIGAYEMGTTPEEVPSPVVTTSWDVEDSSDFETSLREAINYANSNADASEITFDATFTGKPAFIELNDVLPDLTEDVTITGPAIGVGVEANGGGCGCGFGFRIFTVGTGINVSISNLALSNGDEDMGGAIYNDGNLTLTDCSFFDNSADSFGGAIFSSSGSALTLTHCTLVGNGSDNGGAIYNQGMLTVTGTTLNTNSSFDAGAIYNEGTANISNSALSSNLAISGGAIVNTGTLTLSNSTISGNFANSRGGGIDNDGTVIINNSTISDNLGNNTGGGIFSSGTLTLNNSIVALNIATFSGADIRKSSGTIDGDYNLIQDTSGWSFNSGGTHNITGQDPLFAGDLTGNGGPTDTLALQDNSPARNAGSNALLPVDTDDLDGDTNTGEPVPFDQRGDGFPRIENGTVDIGAFETPNNAPVLDASGFVSMTVSGSGSSIADILFYSSLGDAIITDADGDPEGIAITQVLTTNGSWQYSLNGGQSWLALGAVSASNARLLKSNGNTTRLRFLPKGAGGANYPNQLTFRAWDRTSGIEGAFANTTLNGGATAFSSATESLNVLVPNDSAPPQVNINTPASNAVLKQMPAQALGTASDVGLVSSGIRSVTVRLYRNANPITGTAAGYWNGNVANPQFNATYNAAAHERPVALTNGYANWNLALPPRSGSYFLIATAIDGVGKKTALSRSFSVNDGSPQVNIVQPVSSRRYKSSELPLATGTAYDDDAIVHVGVRLYRYANATTGTPEGFWNGSSANPQFAPVYNPAMHERPTTLNGANWSLALPTLAAARYALTATAYDGANNSNFFTHSFYITDGTPRVAITSPQAGVSYPAGSGAGSLTAVTGTTSDTNAAGAPNGDGIVGVTVRLHRKASFGNSEGYWNGTAFTMPYNPVVHDRAASNTASGGAPAFSTWSRSLPALNVGDYSVVASAYDSLGNSSHASTGVQARTTAQSAAPTQTAPDASVSFTIVAAPTASESKLSGAEAISSANSITLAFAGTAPQGQFSVKVNGQAVKVSDVIRSASSLTLLLSDGSLQAGDEVQVAWAGGNTSLIAK